MFKCKNCSRCRKQGKSCIYDVDLLDGLNDDEMDKISNGLVVTDYKKGDSIFRIGDTANKLYIVCSGKMKLFKYLSDGKEQILYIYSTGDFIGAFNLLKADKFAFSAEALEDTSILTLSKEAFDDIAIKNPTITLKILEKAYDRIKGVESLVDRLSSASTDAKVAGLLLNLIEDFGSYTPDGVMLKLSINREEMGSYAGISRETMTRKLNLFRELDYIEFDGNKKILLKDESALRDFL